MKNLFILIPMISIFGCVPNDTIGTVIDVRPIVMETWDGLKDAQLIYADLEDGTRVRYLYRPKEQVAVNDRFIFKMSTKTLEGIPVLSDVIQTEGLMLKDVDLPSNQIDLGEVSTPEEVSTKLSPEQFREDLWEIEKQGFIFTIVELKKENERFKMLLGEHGIKIYSEDTEVPTGKSNEDKPKDSPDDNLASIGSL